jgi:hypothetical protein
LFVSGRLDDQGPGQNVEFRGETTCFFAEKEIT